MKNISLSKTIAYCVTATVLNIILASTVMFKLSLPLFCDTIFSVAILFYFGLTPAVCVQLVYNLLFTFIPLYIQTKELDLLSLLYAFAGLTAIYTTWLFVRKREKLRKNSISVAIYLTMTALISSLTTSITGGLANIIILILNPNTQASSKVEQVIYSFFSLRVATFAATILGRIPVITLDRLIATFIGFGIFKLMCYYDRRQNEKKFTD